MALYKCCYYYYYYYYYLTGLYECDGRTDRQTDGQTFWEYRPRFTAFRGQKWTQIQLSSTFILSSVLEMLLNQAHQAAHASPLSVANNTSTLAHALSQNPTVYRNCRLAACLSVCCRSMPMIAHLLAEAAKTNIWQFPRRSVSAPCS